MIKVSSFSVNIINAVLALALGACATPGSDEPEPSDQPPEQEITGLTESMDLEAMQRSSSGVYAGVNTLQELPPRYREAARVIPGTGNFINQQAATKPQTQLGPDGVVTLNFEAASIRDVVKVVFDTLKENYVIDPQVDGEVTVQTSRPLPKEALIPTLETLLRMNNAALVRVGGVYKVIPISGAVAGNTSPRLSSARLGAGYSVRIFPLRYISATEMEKILQPFAPEGGILRVDPMRNILMLAGTSEELGNLQETISIFDVNWLKGMSVGMYSLQNAESQEVVTELENLFGESSELPLAGMFRFVPIDRLNALLVISPSRDYLREISAWIERLDGSGGERLYVYSIQNGDAEYIAGVLNQVFEGSSMASPVAPPAPVAPGRRPAQLTSDRGTGDQSDDTLGNPLTGGSLSVMQASGSVSSGAGASESGIRIIPDTENNSILIWANSQDYEKVLGALRKLDVRPRQVLVEATIAEVNLTDGLRYGFQWWFDNNLGTYDGVASLDLRTNVPLETDADEPNLLGDGFAYAVVDSAGIIRAILRTLATESKVKILSSPQLMVIDNQEANFQVGEQVPVQTSTTVTTGGNTVESIEFKNTGVLLTVRPQVNEGGLVTMEINQETTDPGQIDPATGQRRFLQRTINSKIAIQSGRTIVLGGLIRENDTKLQRGFPILHKLPVVGPIFGSTNNDVLRTELIVLITPIVVRDTREAEQTTAEIKRRMQSLAPTTRDIFEPSKLRF